MAEASIPVYLITGFLDSGKTTLLRDTLASEGFHDGQRGLLLRCEEGEVPYDPAALSAGNVRLVPVEEPEALTEEFLTEADRRYQPARVLVEYNGMWPVERLRELTLPPEWGLFQVITLFSGETFPLYRANFQSQIVDMASEADLVVFNRCRGDMPLAAWKRSIRAVNPRAQILFEDAQGELLEVEDLLPYDLNAQPVALADADYGIFYLDVQEHPERYLGKTVEFTAQALPAPKLPKGQFIPGRNAMTCCAEDIRFFGLLCKYPAAHTWKKGQWVRVTAVVRLEEAPVYEGEGVVLYASRVTPAPRPADPLVYFV